MKSTRRALFSVLGACFGLLAVSACSGGDVNSWDGSGPTDAGPTDIGTRRDMGGPVDTGSPTDTGPRDTGRDTGTPPRDTGPGYDVAPGTCPPSCTTDSQCTATCPTAAAGHLYCCTFGVCVNQATTVCSAGGDGGGAGPMTCFGLPACVNDSDCSMACGSGARCMAGGCFGF